MLNFRSSFVRYSALNVERDKRFCLKNSFQPGDNLIWRQVDFECSLGQAEFRKLTLSHSTVKVVQEKRHVVIGLEEAGGVEGRDAFVFVVEAREDRTPEGIEGVVDTSGFKC